MLIPFITHLIQGVSFCNIMITKRDPNIRLVGSSKVRQKIELEINQSPLVKLCFIFCPRQKRVRGCNGYYAAEARNNGLFAPQKKCVCVCVSACVIVGVSWVLVSSSTCQ
jgi:hypothetical protein